MTEEIKESSMRGANSFWTKGDFLINTKALDTWGVGILIEDQLSEVVKVFFEHPCEVKTVKTDFLEKIDDPGSARIFLEHALVDEESAAKADREPFPAVLKKYLENFPQGFKGKLHLMEERQYKVEASDWITSNLSEERWGKLTSEDGVDLLSQDIKRAYSKANLLASFEMIKLNEALKDEDAQKAITATLFQLLYGTESLQVRFESTAQILGRYELDKWPTITYLLFMRYPLNYMFVKPEMTKAAALNRGFDIEYRSNLNWNTYSRVLTLAEDLRARLLESANEYLHPLDMIDVQSFMWCTYGKGWSQADIVKAKLKWDVES